MSRSLELLTEACDGLPMSVRKMFGGHGFFAPNGGMFAGVVSDDEVMLKLVAGPARDELISLGGHPWVYQSSQKAMTMAEWIIVPEGFYDDLETFAHWAARAHQLVPPKLAKKPSRKTKAAATPPKKTKRPAKRTKTR